MMVRALFAVAFAAAVSGCATGPTLPPLEVVRVHEAPGKAKGELCRAARDWAAINFRDSNAVIQSYDPDAGSLIGKGVFYVPALMEMWPARFTMVVECKDGRVRATYRDVSVTLGSGTTKYEVPPNDTGLVKARSVSEQKLLDLDASLDASLKKDGGNW